MHTLTGGALGEPLGGETMGEVMVANKAVVPAKPIYIV